MMRTVCGLPLRSGVTALPRVAEERLASEEDGEGEEEKVDEDRRMRKVEKSFKGSRCLTLQSFDKVLKRKTDGQRYHSALAHASRRRPA
ncbi:hypothetical protein [Trinickia sp. EG282A]|uniref:hypothetical protein n=1 Tax=Trinickia sp. EG282A TaxID=3237013 RepID=UPI0034D38D38